jgi:hypothetical protein
MKYLLLYFWFFLCLTSGLKAQRSEKQLSLGQVYTDSTSTRQFQDEFDELPSLKKSNNLIEIRFYSIPSLVDEYDVSVLSYDKQKWSLYRNRKTVLDGKKQMKFVPITFKYGIDSLFNYLVVNNVFALPNHNLKGLGETIYYVRKDHFSTRVDVVTDGYGYCIEFKVGKEFRKYYFNNADHYFKRFPNDNHLRNYSNIIQAFRGMQVSGILSTTESLIGLWGMDTIKKNQIRTDPPGLSFCEDSTASIFSIGDTVFNFKKYAIQGNEIHFEPYFGPAIRVNYTLHDNNMLTLTGSHYFPEPRTFIRKRKFCRNKQ